MLLNSAIPSTTTSVKNIFQQNGYLKTRLLVLGQVLAPRIPTSIIDTCIMYTVLKVSFTGRVDDVVKKPAKV